MSGCGVTGWSSPRRSQIAQIQSTCAPALVVTPGDRRRDHVLRVTDGRVASVIGDGNATSTGIAVIPSDAMERVRSVWDYREVIHRLAKTGTLRAITAAPRFCVTLDAKTDVTALERAYQVHTDRTGLWAKGQLVAAQSRTILREFTATVGRLRLVHEVAR